MEKRGLATISDHHARGVSGTVDKFPFAAADFRHKVGRCWRPSRVARDSERLHAGTIPAPCIGEPIPGRLLPSSATEAIGATAGLHERGAAHAGRTHTVLILIADGKGPAVPYRFSCTDGCISRSMLATTRCRWRTRGPWRTGEAGLVSRLVRAMQTVSQPPSGNGPDHPSAALQPGQLGPTREERPVTGPPGRPRLSLVRAGRISLAALWVSCNILF